MGWRGSRDQRERGGFGSSKKKGTRMAVVTASPLAPRVVVPEVFIVPHKSKSTTLVATIAPGSTTLQASSFNPTYGLPQPLGHLPDSKPAGEGPTASVSGPPRSPPRGTTPSRTGCLFIIRSTTASAHAKFVRINRPSPGRSTS